MKRYRTELVSAALTALALFYVLAWFQVVLSASALEHDRITNGEPTATDQLTISEEP